MEDFAFFFFFAAKKFISTIKRRRCKDKLEVGDVVDGNVADDDGGDDDVDDLDEDDNEDGCNDDDVDDDAGDLRKLTNQENGAIYRTEVSLVSDEKISIFVSLDSHESSCKCGYIKVMALSPSFSWTRQTRPTELRS